ncbi:MAG: hypothetical protein R3218_09865 [Christiangramia sp.]|nr:hypothetical protein [Christiangramia sp.]
MTLLLLNYSCFKDVDLDQYEEIVLTPEAAIDLVFFTITNEDFINTSGNESTAVDETRLDFLDDDYIQNNLIRADFNFRFTNTFASPLTATIRFLSPSNTVQHTIVVPVPSGNAGDPSMVDYTETIFEDQISKIRRSIKVSVEITKHDPTALDGSLQLESKGFYYFEFKS